MDSHNTQSNAIATMFFIISSLLFAFHIYSDYAYTVVSILFWLLFMFWSYCTLVAIYRHMVGESTDLKVFIITTLAGYLSLGLMLYILWQQNVFFFGAYVTLFMIDVIGSLNKYFKKET